MSELLNLENLEMVPEPNQEPPKAKEKKAASSKSPSSRSRSRVASSPAMVLDAGASTGPGPQKEPKGIVEPRHEREWREWLEGLLGPCSVVLVLGLCYASSVNPDTGMATPDGNMTLVEALAFTPDEVHQVARPLAHILAGQNISQKARKRIQESSAYVQLGLFAIGYGSRVYSVINQVREAQNPGQSSQKRRKQDAKSRGVVQPLPVAAERGRTGTEEFPAFLNNGFASEFGSQFKP